MNGEGLIVAALAAGALVLFGGLYGLCYAIGRLRERRAWIIAGQLSYGVQLTVACALVSFTPLAALWKAFIVLSCLGYFIVPPLTWRLLHATHTEEGP